MDIKFDCDKCGQPLKIDAVGLGTVVQCPKCGKSLTVPETAVSTANSGSAPALLIESAATPLVALTKSPAPDTKPKPIQLSASDQTPVLTQTFIDLLRADYDRALASFDTDVKDLIQAGHELKALELYLHSLTKIFEIKETLSTYYDLFRGNVEVLKRFGSERLKQLGYDLMPTYKDVLDLADGVQQVYLRDRIQKNYDRLGIKTNRHWAVPSGVGEDILYMLDTLQILIEPDYVPLSESAQPDAVEDQTDRYIPPTVKLAVWRRDMGKCVQCSSKEKLEYDHIIPVSKGGSNTERNIQLLCEKCNREKAAKIA